MELMSTNKTSSTSDRGKGFSGTIDSINTVSLLQMIHLEKKSLKVKIETKSNTGFFYFRNGDIIHSEYKNMKGKKAAFALLEVKKKQFIMEKEKKDMERTMNMPFLVLLTQVPNKGESIKGIVNSIDLISLLHMMNLEKKSLILKLKINSKNGLFYFLKGEIIHAEYGNMKGEAAAFSLLKEKKGQFSLKKQKKDVKRTIKISFMSLLLNATKHEDEENNLNNKKRKQKEKEEKMNVKKLNQAIEVQKENMGKGLIATDIYGTADGQSIVGWNSNPQASALFNRITNYMTEALDGAGFPSLNKYYILDLAGEKMVIVLNLGKFQWGMLADGKNIQLGMLLNVAIPKMLSAFEDAMKS